MKSILKNVAINLNNSQIARRNFIFEPKTKLIVSFLNILWNEGFIFGYKLYGVNSNLLKIFLKYKKNKPVINSIKLFYNSGSVGNYKLSQLWKLDAKKNLIILNTSKGLMTIQDCKKNQMGGQPLFIIK